MNTPIESAPPGQGPAAPAAGAPVRPILEMRGIGKQFGGIRVLRDVDFVVRPGTVHALVGANGAGKSTMMKILAGVYPDHDGEIVVDGHPVTMTSPRVGIDAGIAVIYQENSLVPDLTVADNIALGRERRAGAPGLVNHRRERRRSQEEAERIGVQLPLDARVSDLQVGEQQMTEIVKAVARQARILVMDEPTARLSPPERSRLFAIIRLLVSQGVGVVYISHFLEEVFEVCNEVTVLRDGQLVGHHDIGDLDVASLARLMVGDKMDELEADASERPARTVSDETSAGLRLSGVSLDGKIAPLDLTVPRGSVLGVTGLENSGRTELASLLVGAITGGSGSIEIGDRYRGRLPRNPQAALRAGMIMVPADRKTDGIVELRSVAENIVLSALRAQLSRAGFRRRRAARELVSEMSGQFGIRPARTDLPISALSGGNQQKALFARAVASGADVLLLDQPTAGVDIGAKVDLYRQIDQMTERGITVLLFSDDLTEILRVSDRVMIMHEGVAGDITPASDYDRASLLAAVTSPRTRHRAAR
jgi:ABC-type sugar transport system ATPase subunit